MKRILVCLSLAFAMIFTVTACGGDSANYNDGTYEGQSEVFINDDGSDDGNGYGVVNIKISDNTITACEFKTYDTDGNLKDENYGKKEGDVANRDYYNKAQKAVAACDQYAAALVESGSIDDVDVISGATINHDEFVEAVNAALDEAKAE